MRSLPATLPALVARGLLDPQLAGLAWLLLERGVPVLVAGTDPGTAASLADALAAALPADRRPDGTAHAHDRLVHVGEVLGPTTPPGPLRSALGRTTGRSGLQALIDAPDLAGVLDVLGAPGAVRRRGLVPRRRPGGGAASRDRRRAAPGGAPTTCVRWSGTQAGHDRRQRPAVLASWDPGADRWEDFAWGIVPGPRRALPDAGPRVRGRARASFDGRRGACRGPRRRPGTASVTPRPALIPPRTAATPGRTNGPRSARLAATTA